MNRPVRILALGAVFGLTAMAQGAKVNKLPAPYTSPGSGPEMYLAYCASCHGLKGAGDGPVASRLKVAPPDLSRLSQRHKGQFPSEQVARLIRGEAETAGHGVKDMPVWGPVFRAFNDRQEAVVQQRVTTLTKYLESLQVK